MRGLSQRELTLIGVLAAALLLTWLLSPSDPEAPAAGVNASGGRRAAQTDDPSVEDSAPAAPASNARDAAAGSGIPKLRLDREGGAPTLRPDVRNLFAYAKSPQEFAAERAEVERLRKAADEARRLQMEMDKKREAERLARIEYERLHPPQPPAPVAPPMNLRLIGFLGPAKSKIAVIADNGPSGNVYMVRSGEEFGEKYKLVALDFGAATVGYSDPKFAHMPTRTFRLGG